MADSNVLVDPQQLRETCSLMYDTAGEYAGTGLGLASHMPVMPPVFGFSFLGDLGDISLRLQFLGAAVMNEADAQELRALEADLETLGKAGGWISQIWSAVQGGGNLLAGEIDAAEKRAASMAEEVSKLKGDAGRLKDLASDLGRMLRTGTAEERSAAAGLLRAAGQDARGAAQLVEEEAKNTRILSEAANALKDARWSQWLRDIAPEIKVFKFIPVLDVLANALGFFSALAEGNSAQEAATRTVVTGLAAAGVAALVAASFLTGVGEIAVGIIAIGAVCFALDWAVTHFWDQIKAFEDWAWSGISTGAEWAWNGVSQAGSWTWNRVTDAGGWVGDRFGDAGSAIGDAWNSVFG